MINIYREDYITWPTLKLIFLLSSFRLCVFYMICLFVYLKKEEKNSEHKGCCELEIFPSWGKKRAA